MQLGLGVRFERLLRPAGGSPAAGPGPDTASNASSLPTFGSRYAAASVAAASIAAPAAPGFAAGNGAAAAGGGSVGGAPAAAQASPGFFSMQQLPQRQQPQQQPVTSPATLAAATAQLSGLSLGGAGIASPARAPAAQARGAAFRLRLADTTSSMSPPDSSRSSDGGGASMSASAPAPSPLNPAAPSFVFGGASQPSGFSQVGASFGAELDAAAAAAGGDGFCRDMDGENGHFFHGTFGGIGGFNGNTHPNAAVVTPLVLPTMAGQPYLQARSCFSAWLAY